MDGKLRFLSMCTLISEQNKSAEKKMRASMAANLINIHETAIAHQWRGKAMKGPYSAFPCLVCVEKEIQFIIGVKPPLVFP